MLTRNALVALPFPQPPVQALNFLDDHCFRRLARWIVARQTAGDLPQVLKSHSDVKPVENRRRGDTSVGENVPGSPNSRP